MKSFAMFLMLAAAVGGIVWYENQPTTVSVPLRVESTTPYMPTTTTIAPHRLTTVRLDQPDVHMQVQGEQGDDIDVLEFVGKPQRLDNLPGDVHSALMGCTGVSDRDMAVKIVAIVKLRSALSAEIQADYRTSLVPAVFNFSEGLTCSDGLAKHTMTPGRDNQLEYWVVLSGVVSPDHPNGNLGQKSWTLAAPNYSLPNLERAHWRLWGPRVYGCTGELAMAGQASLIHVAGKLPESCSPVSDETEALNNG